MKRAARPRHRPRKRFGQHFLAPAWAQKVVRAIDPQPGDVFLEIGPGTGALTLPLAATGAPVLAVEIDRDLVAHLSERVPAHVTLLSGDARELDVVAYLSGLSPQTPPVPGVMVRKRYRVVGNLPYNIATPILLRLIEIDRQHRFFADATLMVQHEVADRLVARAGTKAYGALTIAAAVRTRITRLLNLPPGAFRPAPRVRSTVVRVEFGVSVVRIPDEVLFERLVRALFSARRKTLANALKQFDATAPAVLALAGLDGRRRPETLQVAEIARLADLFATVRRAPVL
ncbi:MAG TPA: 16S rRNA (adenine(1518)-N(6)/adenine(1519)-N(6))-dimethyltransferase RsmA [Vicinamibacterales bacterium]|nr:16S rRNA (adenine(1518)-N(6)/adenine(1519)-N(6))-dimethyltransferase RsmA [Vicinamibacterales bacterium]